MQTRLTLYAICEIFAICAICVALLAGPAAAQPPLADRIPAESLLYIGWAGTGLTFDGSATGQLVSDPATDKAFEAIRQTARTMLGKDQEQLFDSAWEMAAIAWHNPVAFVVTDLASGSSGPEPAGALLVHLGPDRQAFVQHLDSMLQALSVQKNTISETVIGDVTCKVLSVPGGNELYLAVRDDLFIAALGAGTAEQLIALTADKSLASNKKFIECWKDVGGENEQIVFYLDVPSVLDKVEKLTSLTSQSADSQTQGDSPLRHISQILGLGKISAVVGCTRIVDRGMYTKMRVLTPGPHTGLLTILSGSPLTDADLAIVPEDAHVMMAARLSPESLWTETLRMLRQFDPKLEDQLLKKVAAMEKSLELSLTDDILACLGDTITISSAPSQGGFFTGTMASIPVKDAAKLTVALSKIEAYARRIAEAQGGTTIETVKSGRVQIQYLAITSPPMPSAPAWAIHNDRLYFAFWPQVIASALADDGTNRPITAEDAYRKSRIRVSSEASVLYYANTPKILRQVYHWMLLGWTMGANHLASLGIVETRPDWLPPLAMLEKYIWPEIRAVSADSRGITFETYCSLPTGGMLSAQLTTQMGLIAVLMPSLTKAKNLAKQVVSKTNLSGLSTAVMLYMEANDGKAPKALSDLFTDESEKYLSDTSSLVSPLSDNQAPQIVDGQIQGEIDYVYLGVKPDGPVHMIIYERLELHSGRGTNAAFSDGHVQWLSREEYEQELKKAKELLAPAKENAGEKTDF